MNRQRPAAARASRAKQGFTLVELLCAIVVLLLVSALMVTGIQLGIRALNKSVSASEARVLSSIHFSERSCFPFHFPLLR